MESELSERQKAEKTYHNNKYRKDYEVQYIDNNYHEYFFNLIDDVENLKILDFGCGDGWTSIKLVEKGANVVGIDISEELIFKALENKEQLNYGDNLSFQVMAGEDLQFESDSFDMVVGNSVLHHTEINGAINSIYRVLKDGGKAIFVEPMNQNIFLRIWRLLTPWRRSSTEKALMTGDVKFIRSVFSKTNERYFNLFSMATIGLLVLFPKSALAKRLNVISTAFDERIINRLPSLGQYCAVVVLELQKKSSETS